MLYKHVDVHVYRPAKRTTKNPHRSIELVLSTNEEYIGAVTIVIVGHTTFNKMQRKKEFSSSRILHINDNIKVTVDPSNNRAALKLDPDSPTPTGQIFLLLPSDKDANPLTLQIEHSFDDLGLGYKRRNLDEQQVSMEIVTETRHKRRRVTNESDTDDLEEQSDSSCDSNATAAGTTASPTNTMDNPKTIGDVDPSIPMATVDFSSIFETRAKSFWEFLEKCEEREGAALAFNSTPALSTSSTLPAEDDTAEDDTAVGSFYDEGFLLKLSQVRNPLLEALHQRLDELPYGEKLGTEIATQELGAFLSTEEVLDLLFPTL